MGEIRKSTGVIRITMCVNTQLMGVFRKIMGEMRISMGIFVLHCFKMNVIIQKDRFAIKKWKKGVILYGRK